MKFNMIEVGLFRLPGVVVMPNEDEDAPPIPESTFEEMRAWAEQHKCGKEVNEGKHIWMFKKEKERNFFLMRWA